MTQLQTYHAAGGQGRIYLTVHAKNHNEAYWLIVDAFKKSGRKDDLESWERAGAQTLKTETDVEKLILVAIERHELRKAMFLLIEAVRGTNREDRYIRNLQDIGSYLGIVK